jgi:hypothetical protein
MLHGQIIPELYTTLLNLNTTAHGEGMKQKKEGERERERGTQAIIATPLRCRQEGYE